MSPISRLSLRRCFPAPSPCSSILPSFNILHWPVTPTTKPQCRHKTRKSNGPISERILAAQKPSHKPLVKSPEHRKVPSRMEEQVYTATAVPDITFWRSIVPSLGPKDLTPEQCLRLATLYCDGTTKRDHTWAKRLVAETSLTPYALHYLGVMLSHHKPSEEIYLPTNMLYTAHLLDYTPSTLQLILYLERHYPSATRAKDLRLSAPYRSALSRHQSLVRSARDPSALSLQAHLLASTNKPGDAADHFDKAWRVGTSPIFLSTLPQSVLAEPSPRNPRWLFEGTCHFTHGKRMQEAGRTAEAEAAYRVAALQLDQPLAYAALARVVADPAERAEYTLKAAMSGVKSACGAMAGVERGEAERPETDREERRMRILMATEWERLAEA